ncbi:MAG: purine permease [Planctomycetes bacterium]|nr:purine permease [Planctomycetota bacterium]
MTEEKTAAHPEGPLFQFKAKASLHQIVPLGLQHLVAAIVGIVTPAMIISRQAGLDGADATLLIQLSLVFSALATLLQLFPIGSIGSGLPVIIGISFAYLPTMQSIIGQYLQVHPEGGRGAIAVILGAQIAGGVAAFVVGLSVRQIRRFFPPLVTGTVVFTIGLSLYPTALRYFAGGGNPQTNPLFGSWQNWTVASLTLVIVIFFNYFTKGMCKLASILIGMLCGYAAALIFTQTGAVPAEQPMVSFHNVSAAPWFQLVSPLHFGLEFIPTAMISMIVMYVVNSVQAIGDLSSTTMGGMDRQPTDRELAGGIMASGVYSVFNAFFGALPTATYSQNVGIVTVTRVINRSVFAFAAAAMLMAGIVPKFAAVLTTIPQSVIGGATISVFASIAMTGVRMIASASMTPRNLGVVGLAIALGVGITSVPGALAGFPAWVGSAFGSSSVVIATLVAIVLNQILPKDKTDLSGRY